MAAEAADSVSSLDQRISREVAERRRQAGLRQIDMWTALGMAKTSYRELEQCQRKWMVEVLERVAAVLKIRTSDLLRAAEDRTDGPAGPASRVRRRNQEPPNPTDHDT